MFCGQVASYFGLVLAALAEACGIVVSFVALWVLVALFHPGRDTDSDAPAMAFAAAGYSLLFVGLPLMILGEISRRYLISHVRAAKRRCGKTKVKAKGDTGECH